MSDEDWKILGAVVDAAVGAFFIGYGIYKFMKHPSQEVQAGRD